VLRRIESKSSVRGSWATLVSHFLFIRYALPYSMDSPLWLRILRWVCVGCLSAACTLHAVSQIVAGKMYFCNENSIHLWLSMVFCNKNSRPNPVSITPFGEKCYYSSGRAGFAPICHVPVTVKLCLHGYVTVTAKLCSAFAILQVR